MIQVHRINLKHKAGHFMRISVVVRGSWLEERISTTLILCHTHKYLVRVGVDRGFEGVSEGTYLR
jgi:hypothetical protein